MTRRGASWRPRRFPAGFALIEHRTRGAVLFDTGYAPQFAAATRAFPERLYRWMTPVTLDAQETAASQLAARGIGADDVGTIVVSHFHADHVAGLRDFSNAAIVCSRAAWDGVRECGRLGGLRRAFLRELLPSDVAERLSFAEELRAVEIPGALGAFGVARDCFGDGSALVVPLPGHADGHIGLYLPHTPDGPLLLIGDAAWSHAGYARCTPPPVVTTAFLGDTARYRETLRKLAALHRAEPHLRIVPAHAGS